MNRDCWTKALREAERELEAATTRSDVNAAAKGLQRARAELKRLEEAPASQAVMPHRAATAPHADEKQIAAPMPVGPAHHEHPPVTITAERASHAARVLD